MKALLVALLCLPLTGCALLKGKPVAVDHPLQTMDSGVEFEDLIAGEGRIAEDGTTVSIEYVGTLSDGSTFDSTYDRGYPYEFVLGQAPIQGLNEGLRGMRAGGRRRIAIPPDLAYGEEGYPGLIPPRARLHFEVELLSVADP